MIDFPKTQGYWKVLFKDDSHFDNQDYEIAYLYYDGHWKLYRIGESKPSDPKDLNIIFISQIIST